MALPISVRLTLHRPNSLKGHPNLALFTHTSNLFIFCITHLPSTPCPYCAYLRSSLRMVAVLRSPLVPNIASDHECLACYSVSESSGDTAIATPPCRSNPSCATSAVKSPDRGIIATSLMDNSHLDTACDIFFASSSSYHSLPASTQTWLLHHSFR
jgi:hypothetical protein